MTTPLLTPDDATRFARLDAAEHPDVTAADALDAAEDSYGCAWSVEAQLAYVRAYCDATT